MELAFTTPATSYTPIMIVGDEFVDRFYEILYVVITTDLIIYRNVFLLVALAEELLVKEHSRKVSLRSVAFPLNNNGLFLLKA